MKAFDSCIVYEDRDALHTSRLKLEGVKTILDGQNTADGWLWMDATLTGTSLALDLYKTLAGAAGDKVAAASGLDISAAATTPVKFTLAEANSSGMSGEIYVHLCAETVEKIPVMVSLIHDDDLDDHYDDVANLPKYDATVGMAEFCALATEECLHRVSQKFPDLFGGVGVGEHRHNLTASRLVPDMRRLANPVELRIAAIHKALAIAFRTSHDRADETAFSDLGDYHLNLYDQEMAGIHLTIDVDPDSDTDADYIASGGIASIDRV